MNCMSQQGMTIVSLQIEGVDMGDLEFIEGKVIAGNYFQVSGDIDALNDTIEFIVPNGKTAFLIEASLRITSDNPQTNSPSSTIKTTNKVTASLKIDTTTKDMLRLGNQSVSGRGSTAAITGGGGIGSGDNDSFRVKGLSLVGDGIKKIEIENILDSGSAFAVMSGYLIVT